MPIVLPAGSAAVLLPASHNLQARKSDNTGACENGPEFSHGLRNYETGPFARKVVTLERKRLGATWRPRSITKVCPMTEEEIEGCEFRRNPAMLASRKHPEQGFRTCLGILRSYRGLDASRVEAVSSRALELGVINSKGIASLLARKPDDATAKNDPPATLFDHVNLRGPGYYH
jgi:hypothetical protein